MSPVHHRVPAGLGDLAAPVARQIEKLASEDFLRRLWDRDARLWSLSADGQAEVGRRLGWLDSPQKSLARLAVYRDLADEVRSAGISRFLVLGMGGSSLAAEVISAVFERNHGKDDRRLGILDSTDPSQVMQAGREFPPDASLYVVSSKSGGTAEVLAAFEYFWQVTGGDGSRFVAVTDEGTSLQRLAAEKGFRRTFIADASVGGRYAALTDFGLVPAALLGVDIERLLQRAVQTQGENASDRPPGRAPGLVLGAALAEAGLRGRDKITLLSDPGLETLPNWIEQLIAESSGKDGRGLVPVALEPPDAPEVYGTDRFFIYLRRMGGLDQTVEALGHAGFSILTIDVPDPYAVAAEFVRWEIAIAAACHVMGVNAFDQPDVQESKLRTQSQIDLLRSGQHLREGPWDAEFPDVGRHKQNGAWLKSLLDSANAGDYVALNAYLPRRADIGAELQRLRVLLRERTHLATTVGFGPRFQHSTGQLHKGGSNEGLFIQIVSDPEIDLPIPGSGLTFGGLIRAQALGDYETLVARKRRVVRVKLGRPEDVALLRRSLDEPIA